MYAGTNWWNRPVTSTFTAGDSSAEPVRQSPRLPGPSELSKAGPGSPRMEGARVPAGLRSGNGLLSVRARPSSLKRDSGRRTMSIGGKCLVNAHAKLRLTPEPLRTLRSETKGQAGACPDRAQAIPCTVRAGAAMPAVVRDRIRRARCVPIGVSTPGTHGHSRTAPHTGSPADGHVAATRPTSS